MNRKRQLAEVRDRLERLRPEFEKVASWAIDNPDDAKAREELERVLRELEEADESLQKVLVYYFMSCGIDFLKFYLIFNLHSL